MLQYKFEAVRVTEIGRVGGRFNGGRFMGENDWGELMRG